MTQKNQAPSSYKNTLGNIDGGVLGTLKEKLYRKENIIQIQIEEAINSPRKRTSKTPKKPRTKQNTKRIVRDFREYGDVCFDDLATAYMKQDVNHAYTSLVSIQKALVDVLSNHYIHTDGDVYLKPLLAHIKNRRKHIRKLDVALHDDPIVQQPGEVAAQQSAVGALAHSLFEHQLKSNRDYTIMDHDIELDQHYRCDLFVYHKPSNTYLAIDVTTTAQEPTIITDDDHYERITDHLLSEGKIPRKQYTQGAEFRHIIVNPFWKMYGYMSVFDDDTVKNHKKFLHIAQKHIQQLIEQSEVFPHK